MNPWDTGVFGVLPIIVTVVFVLVFTLIIVGVVRGIKEWSHNNKQPRIPAEAKVAAKRTDVSHHHHGGEGMHTSSSTSYYATFEFKSGDRSEFRVSASEFGLLAEGDQGILTSQGTRYIGFERTREI
ncbi:hypothetical protein FACS1894217_05840 [Clostridia bacterium]|nr:hypothetical protein FACS1894217_05840 [Clostridia bacterium]